MAHTPVTSPAGVCNFHFFTRSRDCDTLPELAKGVIGAAKAFGFSISASRATNLSHCVLRPMASIIHSQTADIPATLQRPASTFPDSESWTIWRGTRCCRVLIGFAPSARLADAAWRNIALYGTRGTKRKQAFDTMLVQAHRLADAVIESAMTRTS